MPFLISENLVCAMSGETNQWRYSSNQARGKREVSPQRTEATTRLCLIVSARRRRRHCGMYWPSASKWAECGGGRVQAQPAKSTLLKNKRKPKSESCRRSAISKIIIYLSLSGGEPGVKMLARGVALRRCMVSVVGLARSGRRRSRVSNESSSSAI